MPNLLILQPMFCNEIFVIRLYLVTLGQYDVAKIRQQSYFEHSLHPHIVLDLAQ